MELGHNIVNFSVINSGIQLYLRDRIYDVEKSGAMFSVREWKYRRDGKAQERNRFTVDENWAKEIIAHMLEHNIAHDLFVDGQLTYRLVQAEGGGEAEDLEAWDNDTVSPESDVVVERSPLLKKIRRCVEKFATGVVAVGLLAAIADYFSSNSIAY
jgi:hypothetical protein